MGDQERAGCTPGQTCREGDAEGAPLCPPPPPLQVPPSVRSYSLSPQTAGSGLEVRPRLSPPSPSALGRSCCFPPAWMEGGWGHSRTCPASPPHWVRKDRPPPHLYSDTSQGQGASSWLLHSAPPLPADPNTSCHTCGPGQEPPAGSPPWPWPWPGPGPGAGRQSLRDEGCMREHRGASLQDPAQRVAGGEAHRSGAPASECGSTVSTRTGPEQSRT